MNVIPSEFKTYLVSVKENPSYTNIVEGINFTASLLLVFWLPLYKSFLPYIISFWILTWLLEGNFVMKGKQNIQSKRIIFLLLLPVLFYIIHILGYFQSSNKPSSLFDLEVKLSLLIFPIIFLTANKLYKRYGKLLLKFFITGNVVASIISIGLAIIHSTSFVNDELIFNSAIYQGFSDQSFFALVGNRLSFFSYVKLSAFHHPSYFSMYLIFGVIVSYYLYRTSENIKTKALYIGIILFFYVLVYLLSARAGLLALFTTLISLTIIEFAKSRNYAIVFLVSFLLIIGLYKAMTLSKLKRNIVELNEMAHNDKSKAAKTVIVESKATTKSHNSLEKESRSDSSKVKVKLISSHTPKKDARLIIWRDAVLVIKENILLGVGNGDVRDNLSLKYAEQGFESGIKNRFNTHNQYLESMLSGGLSAILILLTMLGYAFLYSLKHKRILLSFLVCIVSFNFLFESMLNTIAGVIFFSFFYSFLLIYTPPRLESKSKR